MARKRRKAGVGRQNTRKFVSTAVQGPASYISFFKPTWREIRDAADELRATGKEFTDGTSIDASQAEEVLSTNLWGLCVAKFDEWNWVNDENEDLPPLTEMDVGELYGDEVDFLFNCVQRLYMLSEEESGN